MSVPPIGRKSKDSSLPRRALASARALAFASLTAASLSCGGEDAPVAGGRGFQGGPQQTAGVGAGAVDAPPPPDLAPSKVLSREDFGPTSRDPFQAFLGLDDTSPVEAPVAPILRQRDVKLAEYDFGDLTLIAIVISPRGLRPRALFKATDGKSKTVLQGEYFSRAEVLLASVNRDYVEIEIVDEELATNLGLARGETRAIYLKKE